MLVGFHLLLAISPIAICLLPPLYYGPAGWPLGVLLFWAWKYVSLGQMMLLGLWSATAPHRIRWRLMGAGAACAYLAVWPTLGSMLSVEPSFEDLPWDACYPIFCDTVGAIFAAVVFFAGASSVLLLLFGMLRLGFRHEVKPAARRLNHSCRMTMLVMTGVGLLSGLLFGNRFSIGADYYNETAESLLCVAFAIEALSVAWIMLATTTTCWKVLVVLSSAALLGLCARITVISGMRIWSFAGCWLFVCISAVGLLLPLMIIIATLSVVRTCGYSWELKAALRFTVRELLSLVAVVCLGLASVVVPAENQRCAVAALDAVEGYIAYTDIDDGRWGAFPANIFRSWLPENYFQRVERASLSGATDDSLAYLPALRGLKILYIDGTGVTDAGMAPLCKLTSLEELSLVDTQVTDVGLANLCDLKHLKSLWLEDTPIADDGLAHLAKMIDLETISLAGTRVTDDGLIHLRGLKNLEQLDLERTSVIDPSPLRRALPNCKITGQ